MLDLIDRPTSETRQPGPAALRERVAELLQEEIDFIPNDGFEAELAREEAETLGVNPRVEDSLEVAQRRGTAPADLPAHLRRMCESELLTQEQERELFRSMNYLKFRANALRCRLSVDDPDAQLVWEIDGLLTKAQALRDHLIKANMRLVMSIVKKFVTPQQSFDEMLSDGIMTLMQAVDKFDFDRGFRFSTYAYRSIARHAYRSVTAARKEEARFACDLEEWVFEQQDHRTAASSMSDQVWGNLRELTTSMLDQLDRRERFIVRSRYALGSHRKVKTFQYLADKLGVSKERVRQLEHRAVTKLRAMADELEQDELFGAAMV